MNNSRSKRDLYNLYYDVLSVLATRDSRANQLMRACRLDTRLYKVVLTTLIKQGLVETTFIDGIKYYRLSNRGFAYLRLYESMLDLLNTPSSSRIRYKVFVY